MGSDSDLALTLKNLQGGKADEARNILTRAVEPFLKVDDDTLRSASHRSALRHVLLLFNDASRVCYKKLGAISAKQDRDLDAYVDVLKILIGVLRVNRTVLKGPRHQVEVHKYKLVRTLKTCGRHQEAAAEAWSLLLSLSEVLRDDANESVQEGGLHGMAGKREKLSKAKKEMRVSDNEQQFCTALTLREPSKDEAKDVVELVTGSLSAAISCFCDSACQNTISAQRIGSWSENIASSAASLSKWAFCLSQEARAACAKAAVGKLTTAVVAATARQEPAATSSSDEAIRALEPAAWANVELAVAHNSWSTMMTSLSLLLQKNRGVPPQACLQVHRLFLSGLLRLVPGAETGRGPSSTSSAFLCSLLVSLAASALHHGTQEEALAALDSTEALEHSSCSASVLAACQVALHLSLAAASRGSSAPLQLRRLLSRMRRLQQGLQQVLGRGAGRFSGGGPACSRGCSSAWEAREQEQQAEEDGEEQAEEDEQAWGSAREDMAEEELPALLSAVALLPRAAAAFAERRPQERGQRCGAQGGDEQAAMEGNLVQVLLQVAELAHSHGLASSGTGGGALLPVAQQEAPAVVAALRLAVCWEEWTKVSPSLSRAVSRVLLRPSLLLARAGPCCQEGAQPEAEQEAAAAAQASWLAVEAHNIGAKLHNEGRSGQAAAILGLLFEALCRACEGQAAPLPAGARALPGPGSNARATQRAAASSTTPLSPSLHKHLLRVCHTLATAQRRQAAAPAASASSAASATACGPQGASASRPFSSPAEATLRRGLQHCCGALRPWLEQALAEQRGVVLGVGEGGSAGREGGEAKEALREEVLRLTEQVATLWGKVQVRGAEEGRHVALLAEAAGAGSAEGPLAVHLQLKEIQVYSSATRLLPGLCSALLRSTSALLGSPLPPLPPLLRASLLLARARASRAVALAGGPGEDWEAVRALVEGAGWEAGRDLQAAADALGPALKEGSGGAQERGARAAGGRQGGGTPWRQCEGAAQKLLAVVCCMRGLHEYERLPGGKEAHQHLARAFSLWQRLHRACSHRTAPSGGPNTGAGCTAGSAGEGGAAGGSGGQAWGIGGTASCLLSECCGQCRELQGAEVGVARAAVDLLGLMGSSAYGRAARTTGHLLCSAGLQEEACWFAPPPLHPVCSLAAPLRRGSALCLRDGSEARRVRAWLRQQAQAPPTLESVLPQAHVHFLLAETLASTNLPRALHHSLSALRLRLLAFSTAFSSASRAPLQRARARLLPRGQAQGQGGPAAPMAEGTASNSREPNASSSSSSNTDSSAASGSSSATLPGAASAGLLGAEPLRPLQLSSRGLAEADPWGAVGLLQAPAPHAEGGVAWARAGATTSGWEEGGGGRRQEQSVRDAAPGAGNGGPAESQQQSVGVGSSGESRRVAGQRPLRSQWGILGDYLASLRQLAALQEQMGAAEEVEPRLVEGLVVARAMRLEAVAAQFQVALAGLCRRMGQWGRALGHLREAAEGLRRVGQAGGDIHGEEKEEVGEGEAEEAAGRRNHGCTGETRVLAGRMLQGPGREEGCREGSGAQEGMGAVPHCSACVSHCQAQLWQTLGDICRRLPPEELEEEGGEGGGAGPAEQVGQLMGEWGWSAGANAVLCLRQQMGRKELCAHGKAKGWVWLALQCYKRAEQASVGGLEWYGEWKAGWAPAGPAAPWMEEAEGGWMEEAGDKEERGAQEEKECAAQESQWHEEEGAAESDSEEVKCSLLGRFEREGDPAGEGVGAGGGGEGEEGARAKGRRKGRQQATRKAGGAAVGRRGRGGTAVLLGAEVIELSDEEQAGEGSGRDAAGLGRVQSPDSPQSGGGGSPPARWPSTRKGRGRRGVVQEDSEGEWAEEDGEGENETRPKMHQKLKAGEQPKTKGGGSEEEQEPLPAAKESGKDRGQHRRGCPSKVRISGSVPLSPIAVNTAAAAAAGGGVGQGRTFVSRQSRREARPKAGEKDKLTKGLRVVVTGDTSHSTRGQPDAGEAGLQPLGKRATGAARQRAPSRKVGLAEGVERVRGERGGGTEAAGGGGALEADAAGWAGSRGAEGAASSSSPGGADSQAEVWLGRWAAQQTECRGSEGEAAEEAAAVAAASALTMQARCLLMLAHSQPPLLPLALLRLLLALSLLHKAAAVRRQHACCSSPACAWELWEGRLRGAIAAALAPGSAASGSASASAASLLAALQPLLEELAAAATAAGPTMCATADASGLAGSAPLASGVGGTASSSGATRCAAPGRKAGREGQGGGSGTRKAAEEGRCGAPPLAACLRAALQAFPGSTAAALLSLSRAVLLGRGQGGLLAAQAQAGAEAEAKAEGPQGAVAAAEAWLEAAEGASQEAPLLHRQVCRLLALVHAALWQRQQREALQGQQQQQQQQLPPQKGRQRRPPAQQQPLGEGPAASSQAAWRALFFHSLSLGSSDRLQWRAAAVEVEEAAAEAGAEEEGPSEEREGQAAGGSRGAETERVDEKTQRLLALRAATRDCTEFTSRVQQQLPRGLPVCQLSIVEGDLDAAVVQSLLGDRLPARQPASHTAAEGQASSDPQGPAGCGCCSWLLVTRAERGAGEAQAQAQAEAALVRLGQGGCSEDSAERDAAEKGSEVPLTAAGPQRSSREGGSTAAGGAKAGSCCGGGRLPVQRCAGLPAAALLRQLQRLHLANLKSMKAGEGVRSEAERVQWWLGRSEMEGRMEALLSRLQATFLSFPRVQQLLGVAAEASAPPAVQRTLQLVLDHRLQVLPWESAPLLCALRVYRMPSLAATLAVLPPAPAGQRNGGRGATLHRCSHLEAGAATLNRGEAGRGSSRGGEGATQGGRGRVTGLRARSAAGDTRQRQQGVGFRFQVPQGGEEGRQPPAALVERHDAVFLVNPGGDLRGTEERLQGCRSISGWQGSVSKPLPREELRRLLAARSLFVYCGHGTGEIYLPRGSIRQLPRCAAALLMGCSSARIAAQGDFEPPAMPLAYLCGGAPAVVATLWDVTDRDIDRFCVAMLLGWLPEEAQLREGGAEGGQGAAGRTKSMEGSEDDVSDVAAAVAKSRKACRLPHMVGAAPVCFGVPTTVTCKEACQNADYALP